jgi:hypothetical protein
MAGRVKQALDEISKKITIINSQVKFDHGKRSIHKHTKPPHVTWVRDEISQRDIYEAPKHSSLDKRRVVANRRVTVQAHCWGATEQECEELVDLVVWAIIDFKGSDQIEMQGSWSTDGIFDKGMVCELEFVLIQPVCEPDNQVVLVQPDSVVFDTTGASSTDSLLDVGEG